MGRCGAFAADDSKVRRAASARLDLRKPALLRLAYRLLKACGGLCAEESSPCGCRSRFPMCWRNLPRTALISRGR